MCVQYGRARLTPAPTRRSRTTKYGPGSSAYWAPDETTQTSSILAWGGGRGVAQLLHWRFIGFMLALSLLALDCYYIATALLLHCYIATLALRCHCTLPLHRRYTRSGLSSPMKATCSVGIASSASARSCTALAPYRCCYSM